MFLRTTLSTLYSTGKYVYSFVPSWKTLRTSTTPPSIRISGKPNKVVKRDKFKGYLYAFPIPYDNKKSVYKVGKSVNVTNRLKAYQTLHPNNKQLHQVQCRDMHNAEKILHALLKMQGAHVQRELFSIDGKVLTEYMNLVQKLCQKTSLSVSDMQKLNRVL